MKILCIKTQKLFFCTTFFLMTISNFTTSHLDLVCDGSDPLVDLVNPVEHG